MEWSVEVQTSASPGVLRQAADVYDAVLDHLAEHGGVLTIDLDGGIGARVAVEAPDLHTAIYDAVALLAKAAASADVALGAIVHAEATEWTRFAAELDQPNFPDLVGVTELSALLGVTRQRAHAIAGRNDFPAPVARLASGPIWTRPSVQRFLEDWQRKPGRPAKPRDDDAVSMAADSLMVAAMVTSPPPARRPKTKSASKVKAANPRTKKSAVVKRSTAGRFLAQPATKAVKRSSR